MRLGGAWNAPLPLVVRQEGEPELRVDARWSTRAFEFPLYYGARAAWERGASAWALDLIHHKLHLANPPSEIESFSVSHGYNLLTVERRDARRSRVRGVAAGVVLAHPESRVRGRRLAERGGLWRSGYHVAGPCVAVLGGLRRPVRGGWFWTLEARATLAYARVPVAGGSARVPNLALHGTAGLGWGSERRVP